MFNVHKCHGQFMVEFSVKNRKQILSLLAIRRLRRLLARPTGGSLAALGNPPPPLASLAHPLRCSLRSPTNAPNTNSPEAEVCNGKHSLNWPRYIQ